MSCHHEYDADGHDHSHDHGSHDHSNDIEPALQSNLYKQIDFDAIRTLNEAESGSGAAVVRKTWNERLNETPLLESDADEQILMYIPFSASCKLYSILIHPSTTPSSPSSVKLYRNRDDLDFSAAADLKPTQTISVPQSNEVVEIPLTRAHWNGTTSITLFFEDNWGGGDEDVTKVGYIGFKGDWLALNREPVSVLYEAAANPSDHVAIQGLAGTGQSMQGQ